MSHDHNHLPPENLRGDARYRQVLAWVMAINFAMFIIEIITSYLSHSVSLLADSVDFFSDGFNSLISIYVLAKSIKLRAGASIFKALTMLGFAGVVIYNSWNNYTSGTIPNPLEMCAIGSLALCANLAAAVLLYKFRKGDSNQMSLWLCTRNDALGNIVIIIAGVFVYLLRSNLPDLIVAVVMGILAIAAALKIFRKAAAEIN